MFAGYLEEERDNGLTVVLTNARCAIRFATTGGFLELATAGPNEESKIGSEAEQITLYDVTSKVICSDKAEAAWRDAA